MRRVAQECGDVCSDDELMGMLSLLDKDGDGEVLPSSAFTSQSFENMLSFYLFRVMLQEVFSSVSINAQCNCAQKKTSSSQGLPR